MLEIYRGLKKDNSQFLQGFNGDFNDKQVEEVLNDNFSPGTYYVMYTRPGSKAIVKGRRHVEPSPGEKVINPSYAGLQMLQAPSGGGASNQQLNIILDFMKDLLFNEIKSINQKLDMLLDQGAEAPAAAGPTSAKDLEQQVFGALIDKFVNGGGLNSMFNQQPQQPPPPPQEPHPGGYE